MSLRKSTLCSSLKTPGRAGAPSLCRHTNAVEEDARPIRARGGWLPVDHDCEQEDGWRHQDDDDVLERERHAATIGAPASVVKRLARSAVAADEGRHVDGLAPGDAGS